jgi:predicted CXXCH cytochrome family protein
VKGPALSLKNLRQQSPQLVLAVSFTIVVMTVSMTLLCSSESVARENDSPRPTTAIAGHYQGPNCCRDCHETEFVAWSRSSHAQAVIDPLFQVDLKKAEQPQECFACHTTGYDKASGRFQLAGVTCEACHGPLLPNHPEQLMKVPVTPERCGECHTAALTDWQTGLHGQPDQSCIDCHQLHSWTPPTF